MSDISMGNKNSSNVSNSRISKRALSIGLAAVLVLSSIVVALPVNAQAAPTITTSVDAFGGKFFGPSLVRVVINDPAKAGSPVDTIIATVEVVGKGTANVQVNEIGTSGQFEFYIAAHTTAFPANPTNPGLPGGSGGTDDGYTIVRIGASAGTEPVTQDPRIDTQLSSTTLDKDDTIKISYTGVPQPKELTFDPRPASLSVDRTLAGDGNKIILRVNDPDANVDPTQVDIIPANNNIISANFTLSFSDAGSDNKYKAGTDLVFKETGSNTGIFELGVIVNGTVSVNNAAFSVSSFPSSITFTFTDHEVYGRYGKATAGDDNIVNEVGYGTPATAMLAANPYHEEKPTSSTPSVTVQLRNSDGSIDLAAPLTIANGFQIKVTDPDRNIDTTAKDSFVGDGFTLSNLKVSITGTGSPVDLPITFKETDNNTGVFLPDLAGNKIQIVPRAGATLTLPSGVTNAGNIVSGKIVLGSDNKIYVLASAISEDIDLTISYTDPAADPTGSKTFSIVRKIQHFAGNISTTTTSVPVTGKAAIEINDMDLNLNPDAIDVYTLTYTNGNSPSGAFNGLAALKIKVNGSTSITFNGGNTSIQLVETDKNTGVFKGELDVGDIATPSLTDGDKITFEYEDNTESPTLTRSVDVKIGKPSGTVELDRSSYPPTITSVGTTKLHITITDPSFNTSSTSTNVLPIQKGKDNNAGTFDEGQLKIELIKGSTKLTFNPNASLGFPTSANETGVNTGVFTVDVNLPANVNVDANNNVTGVNVATPDHVIADGWQIRVVYKDSNGDEQTATATVTTNTAQITTDKPTYDLGQTIILRVVERDWNFDSDKVDEIQLSAINLKVDSDKVDERELEDPTLAGAAYTLDPSNSLRETDKNSGIFEIKLKDINNKLVSRGKNLTFIYEDKTPSGGGDEIEVKHTVLITSATVDIMFDKEAYTPFDRVIVTIIDPGANTNSDSKDKLDGSQGKGRVKIVVGGTSKTAGQDPGIDIFEETDNNSGVFKYKDSKGIKITDINSNAKPGDSIRVEYRSPDREIEISKSVPIIFSNGTISLDKDSYKPGETAVITINDPDENRNPDIPDQFEVKVVSTTDPAGISVTVRETGDRTGVFKADVILTTDLSSGSRLQVREGDQITAIYTDETLPNAQTIKMELVNRDNVTDLRTLQTLDVQASAVVGVLLAPTERTTVAKPSLRDQAGNVLQQASVDVPVSIASSIKNNTQQPQKFVYIVQVKDADGFVVSISTVGGTLPAGQSFDVSASWTPTAAGTYTVEVFVWSELGKPSPLSKVETATVTVV
jgi:hypothetical protein